MGFIGLIGFRGFLGFMGFVGFRDANARARYFFAAGRRFSAVPF